MIDIPISTLWSLKYEHISDFFRDIFEDIFTCLKLDGVLTLEKPVERLLIEIINNSRIHASYASSD